MFRTSKFIMFISIVSLKFYLYFQELTRFVGLNIFSKVHITILSIGLNIYGFFSSQRSNHSHRTKFLLNKLSTSDDLLTQKEILGGILVIKNPENSINIYWHFFSSCTIN